MPGETFHMSKKAGVVTTTELKQLLTRLVDNTLLGVCIRTRCVGEMWHPNFMRVLMLTDKGVVILNDEIQRRAIIIPYVRDIIQFELDQRFEAYQPHFHYTVQHE